MTTRMIFFAPCPLGLEGLLAEELKALGAARVRAARAGVGFEGDLATGYAACLWSRVASRVLLRIAEVPASDTDELYAGIREIPWEDHLDVSGTLAVEFTAARSPIAHTKYGALRVKDAIVDRFRDRTGERPSVDRVAPDVLVNVASRARSAVVSIDLAGDPLHRRGYREAGIQVEAPLKENLAAGVLLFAEWPRIAAAGGSFVDPMCGSGTLLIEAAMMAADMAPGSLRARWGFDGWLGHDAATWDELLDEADSRAEAGRAALPPMIGRDLDPRAVAVAGSCVKRAGFAGLARVEQGDVRELDAGALAPESGGTGLVAFNPPYGERLGRESDLVALYASIGVALRRSCAGWQAATVTSETVPYESFGLREVRSHAVFNGPIASVVRVGRVQGSPAGSATSGAEVVLPTTPGGEMFANRLRKNLKRLGKWARKTGVSCYRVYDADMPEYAVAVDLYEGSGPDAKRRFAHVAEYAAPKDVAPEAAKRRLDEALAQIPIVLDVDPADVHVKERRRQRGSAQYDRMDRRGEIHTVEEAGLQFEVNLSDYLDTGLFLDHRITRGMVRDAARDARFLNLFAYTGSATVYAAAGGARSTTTVDLSATYLEWARRNMARNGFAWAEHQYAQADVLAWLDLAGESSAGDFDLIFCDPPTFSNSKRMEGVFDVQRDHARLLSASARLLAPGGLILFSNNLRSFKLDDAALAAAGLSAEDITPTTIPEDFARNPRIHRVWSITRV